MSEKASAFSTIEPPSKEALDKAFQTSVTDEKLQKVSFGDLIKSGDAEKTFCVFLRHFHCGECQQYVMQINTMTSPEGLKAKGAQLLFIGSGDPKDIQGYNDLTQNKFRVFASPPDELYTTLGMTNRTLDLGKNRPSYSQKSVFGNLFWSLGNMFKMGSFVDIPNVTLQGGEFLIDRDGKVLFTHRMANSRDHTETKDLLAKAGIEVS